MVRLKALDYRSNNKMYRPVLQALALFRRYVPQQAAMVPAGRNGPDRRNRREPWEEAVIEHDPAGKVRINRVMIRFGMPGSLYTDCSSFDSNSVSMRWSIEAGKVPPRTRTPEHWGATPAQSKE
jgi:hypothetical protein